MEGPSDVVVDVVEMPVLDVQRVAAGGAALAQQDSLDAAVGDFDVGGDAVGAVEHPWRGVERDRLGIGPVGELVAWFGDGRLLGDDPGKAAAVEIFSVMAGQLHGQT